LAKEKSFSTAAILKEYGAKYMSGSPSASKWPLAARDLWIEALSSNIVVVFLQSWLSLSSYSMRPSMKRQNVKVLFFP